MYRRPRISDLLETGAYDDRLTEEARHQLVHEGVRVDKIEGQIGQRSGVVDALAGPRVRNLGTLNRQPVRVDGALFLEVTLERVGDVLQGKGADGRAADAVHWGSERAVNQLRRLIAVLARYQFRR